MSRYVFGRIIYVVIKFGGMNKVINLLEECEKIMICKIDVIFYLFLLLYIYVFFIVVLVY